MQLSIVIYLLAAPLVTLSAVRSPKEISRRPQKPINGNLSHYSEPFKFCKELRPFNPVERFRAHGEAVDMFRKCGPSLVEPYATKYKFPAFGKFSNNRFRYYAKFPTNDASIFLSSRNRLSQRVVAKEDSVRGRMYIGSTPELEASP